MPKWMHDRAEHIMSKNKDMSKSEAFAIATQQMHATGKGPKSYGASEGRQEAKEKYDEPKKSYVQTANPKTASVRSFSQLFAGFSNELQKIAIASPVAPTGITPFKPMTVNPMQAASSTGVATQAKSIPKTAPINKQTIKPPVVAGQDAPQAAREMSQPPPVKAS